MAKISQWWKPTSFLGIVILYALGLVLLNQNDAALPVNNILHVDATPNITLPFLCQKVVNKYNEIILVVVDMAVFEETMNFYYSNIVKHQLKNVLFVGLHGEICQKITHEDKNHLTHCFVKTEDTDAYLAPEFHSIAFNRKASFKTRCALEIIQLGYTVLISDVDIYYFKDPLPYLRNSCNQEHCDVACQLNGNGHFNSGFMFLKSSKLSLELLSQMVHKMDESSVSDQPVFNGVLPGMVSTYNLSIVRLPEMEFPTGNVLFNNKGGGCPNMTNHGNAIILHNNFLCWVEDKIMRFKDCFMWEYNGPEDYYDSMSRKYIIYSGPVQSEVKMALLNGFVMGNILNRTFILPRGEGNKASHRLVMDNFKPDSRRFYNVTSSKYRESSFLENRHVPDVIRDSLSDVIDICRIIYPLTNQGSEHRSMKDIVRILSKETKSILRVDPITCNITSLNYAQIMGEYFMDVFR